MPSVAGWCARSSTRRPARCTRLPSARSAKYALPVRVRSGGAVLVVIRPPSWLLIESPIPSPGSDAAPLGGGRDFDIGCQDVGIGTPQQSRDSERARCARMDLSGCFPDVYEPLTGH